MSTETTSQDIQNEEALVPPPNYALDVLLFILKTIFIAAAVFGLAWALVNVKL